MIQLAIIILGGLGAALIAAGGKLALWGFACALLAQPFWIAATWRTRQWGMLAMAIYYSGVWAFGALRAWGA